MNQKELQEILHYDPATGVFTYLKRVMVRLNIGDVAGTRTHHKGYVYIKISGKQYAAHRLAWLYMTGEWPEYEIDHKNGVKDNNQFKNLRPTTHAENGKNQKKHITNTSGVMGVNWHKRDRIWQASITIDCRKRWIGSFLDWWDAVCARKSAEAKLGYHPNHGRAS